MKDKEFLIQNGVDVDKSLELFGDMETYNDILNDFIEELESKREYLKKYKEISDMSNYTIYAHSVKSDAKSFGFDMLAEYALNHETASKKNNMYYVVNHYDEFMHELSRVERVVKEYLNIPVINDSDIITIRDEEILVVDDSLVIKKFIQNIFHNKYHILEAGNGNEAIQFLKEENKIKKMLLDLNMPNANGFDVLKFLDQNGLFDKIEVTVITGVGASDIIDEARKYQVKDIILKPFNERDIKHIIESEDI